MRQGRPVAVIAELEGLEEDYCRKATRRLAAEHDIQYNPVKPSATASRELPPGITDESRSFRNRMANLVHDLRNAPGRHPLDLCHLTGLTQSQQTLASERGGTHDYKLSQLERLARANDQSFKQMMLERLLSPDEYQKVKRCLNI